MWPAFEQAITVRLPETLLNASGRKDRLFKSADNLIQLTVQRIHELFEMKCDTCSFSRIQVLNLF